jgi:hypothetical protein
MSVSLPELSANPLALIRSLPTSMIPLDQIKVPEGLAEDKIFFSRYSAFLRGKAPIHETRVSLDRIRRGFWTRTDEVWSLAGDQISDMDLNYAVDMVRLGSRPVLHLYENPNPSDQKRYVCTDDTVMHAAYERLGLTKVPVALMGKPRNLEESCLSVRCFRRGSKDSIPLLEGVVPVVPDLVPSILGVNKPSAVESFDRLLKVLSETKVSVKRFHKAGATTHHYHHTLYSVLLRAEDCIQSIKILTLANKPLTAAGLLRSLYELALVFYVDWIAPGQTYRYLQMASVTTEKEWESSCESWRKADIANGASAIEAKNIKDAHIRSFRLGCVVGERARIFPLGERFQRDIYSFLSDVIHHDFSMTARYAHTLDHGDEAVYHDDAVKTTIHVVDLLVGAIVSRISSDIGSHSPVLSGDA